jgi:hypothetical protein
MSTDIEKLEQRIIQLENALLPFVRIAPYIPRFELVYGIYANETIELYGSHFHGAKVALKGTEKE